MSTRNSPLLDPPQKKARSTTAATARANTATNTKRYDDIIDAGKASSIIILEDYHNEKAPAPGEAELVVAGNYKRPHHHHIGNLSLLPDAILLDVLKFVGPGHYLFVALTCRRLKELYTEYFSKLQEKEIPLVRYQPFGAKTKANMCTSFYSLAFSNAVCADFWDQDTNGDSDRLPDMEVCRQVGKHGHLEVLQWASAKWWQVTFVRTSRC